MVYLFLFLLILTNLFAATPSKRKPRYELSICSTIKDETKHLKEWIEYHQLVGVNHFYLYNFGSEEKQKEALKSYIKSGLVTLVRWFECVPERGEEHPSHWCLSSQIPAFENAIHVRALATTKWLACLDTNEYLVPLKTDQLQTILEKHEDCAGVILPTDCFDLSVKPQDPTINLIIQHRDLIAAPDKHLFRSTSKMIFKPTLCNGFSYPPYKALFKDGAQVVEIDRAELRVNRYVLEDQPYLENLKRRAHVDNRQMSASELEHLLQQGYEIEDQEKATDRFLPKLRKQLGQTP
ncbi:MAG: hypothetical protein A3E80_05065 [Chlamydiae bacterium RIFCSPHIGHO2_12_FULL_49_9]|nr:MAG: hypothetical protein A3E80_05065 [Chlamydiae bacterium RIFCSPHIGHO2_12_FULL_49_9]